MAEPTTTGPWPVVDYCRFCGQWSDHWPGCPGPSCPRCRGSAMIERMATPDEVDAGCELGVAYDLCDACRRPAPPPP